MKEDPRICLTVHYWAQSGRSAEVIAFLRMVALGNAQEPGMLDFQVYQAECDPHRILVYEVFVDQAGLDAHRASDHYDTYVRGGVFPLLRERTVEAYRPAFYQP
ncbi:antibiotic biosynthesis monooxygenase [Hymenobacter sp. BT664]|uniref:Antibiotic biosynthesis monooxygenase n=1 Tax=Hymenobacter montanus TaxID=2771359 RepID=A0A927B9T5_9BACT|nr:antibiotic biosynthesis monooxygenase [Hymenobacter montanus]MBD2766775.1 antibiotic biosynthesis monooxygenase [Hymenobacter montanus]